MVPFDAEQPEPLTPSVLGRFSISERPGSVEDLAIPRHWEGDLICEPNNSFVATLVERHARYVMLAKLSGRHIEAVVNARIKQVRATGERTP